MMSANAYRGARDHMSISERDRDLTAWSSAFLRRLADECERIIEERANDGVMS